jgi:rubrerythrin
MKSNIYNIKHNVWLVTLFSSFAIKDETISKELYEFAMIEFRHLRWLSRELKAIHVEYNYDREEIHLEKTTLHETLKNIIWYISNASLSYEQNALFERIKTDEHYILNRLNIILDEVEDIQINAYNKALIYGKKDLDKDQTNALTMFLFEESYKEYELIMVYSYMQNYTESLQENDIFQDLIDESQYHLKRFGEMMATMGILAIPRELHEKTYKIEDVSKFIESGIKEELAAKEMCRELASKINDEELSGFFDFINYQESYHIELMKKLLT